jgi:hypothetical protein
VVDARADQEPAKQKIRVVIDRKRRAGKSVISRKMPSVLRHCIFDASAVAKSTGKEGDKLSPSLDSKFHGDYVGEAAFAVGGRQFQLVTNCHRLSRDYIL